MVRDLYSAELAEIDRSALRPAVRDAASAIEAAFGPVRVLGWNDRFIAVAMELRIDLPTRGTFEGIDIRRREPVLLQFDQRDFPGRAPFARSDRRDFPVDRVSHLNPVGTGEAPWLCLHRGSIDDWFAEHSIRDYVERVRSWYRDAAAGRLMREDDAFDPTRIATSDRTMIFSARAMNAAVLLSWAQSKAAGHGFAFVSAGGDAVAHTGWAANVALSVRSFILPEPDAKMLEIARDLNALTLERDDCPRSTIGIYAWTRPQPVATYFGNLPASYAELVAFADRLGIPLEAAIDDLIAADAQLLQGIPVALGILRPRPVHGTASPLEWLCFAILSEDAPRPEDTVISLSHREPLTPAFARTLSAAKPCAGLERPLVIGCGAVGSKLALHLARAGFVSQRLVDHASLTPHHVVRHGLLGDSLGQPKARGLSEAIARMYPGRDDLDTEHIVSMSSDVLADAAKLEDRSILIDTTASAAMHGELVRAALPPGLRVCRAEIADEGRLGVLAYEGPDRNPRLDDLQAHLFGLARSDARVASWLQGAAKDRPDLEDIQLGLGCSSATLRISDDIVSAHAAAFSRTLRRLAAQDQGHLLLACEREDSASRELIAVPPVVVLPASGRVDWSVRLSAGALASMRQLLAAHGRKETGGLLIGYVNAKREIVYITHALDPSRDSLGTEDFFVRGSQGYPQAVKEIESKTGGLLGYVGDWHTHPDGPARPSALDHKALAAIDRSLRPAGIPGLLLIVSATAVIAVMSATR